VRSRLKSLLDGRASARQRQPRPEYGPGRERRSCIDVFIFNVGYVVWSRQAQPSAETVVSPPTVPRGLRLIAGAGLIEAKREIIPIGTVVAGVVTEVNTKRGDMVKRGDVLFRLDDRDLRAQPRIATATLILPTRPR
jgi:multidrug efflux pump subunit AcrA (membrane-fusion protein)